jgi:tRNA (Thr-GGU) A37 N-methylase
MTRRARSARGETVDFDLLSIKAQEAAKSAGKKDATPVVEIKPTESFIDKRNKRRIKKATATVEQVATIDIAPKETK